MLSVRFSEYNIGDAVILWVAATRTTLVSRAEVATALAKAVRFKALTQEEALAALQVFRSNWVELMRLREIVASEVTVPSN